MWIGSPLVEYRRFMPAGVAWTASGMICALLMMQVVLLPLAERGPFYTIGMVGLVLCWAGNGLRIGQMPFRATPLDRSILLFSAWGLLSVLFSMRPLYSLQEFQSEMVTHFFFFYLVVLYLETGREIHRVLSALTVGAALMGCFGIYEVLSTEITWTRGAARLASLTSDYNYASTYFILVIPILFYAMRTARTTPIRMATLLLLGINLFSLYFTFSRAAWLGLVAASVVMAFYEKRAVLWITVAGIVVVSFLLFTTPQGERFFQSMNGVDGGGRLPVLAFGAQQVAAHPLLGIGYGRESMVRALSVPAEMRDVGFWHLHNLFLQTALEMGIPGSLLLLAVIVGLARVFHQGYRRARNPRDRRFMVAMQMVLVAYLVRNQFDVLYVNAPAALFWILMGLGVRQSQILHDDLQVSVSDSVSDGKAR